MNLRGIVAVSGKPGLWKVIAQNKGGFILEGLDSKKTKLVVANVTTVRMSALEDITIFGDQDELRLVDILENMKTAHAVPDLKDDQSKMRKFFDEVAPGHDHERVYQSDIKKVISWFNVLKDFPIFNEEAPAPLDQPAIDAAAASAKKQGHEDEKPKPVAKAAGKGSNRLPRKAS